MSRLKIRRHEKAYGELTLEVGRTYILGRKEEADVALQPDPGISREHLKIEYADGFWVAQVLSQHIPITFEGRSMNVLVCKTSPSHFYISPYHFELIGEEAEVPQPSDAPVISEDSPMGDDPLANLSELRESPNSSESEFNENNSFVSAPPPPSTREESVDAIDPEVSFHGNEEETKDVFQGDEPYLKFMYATHSESIRLKGNKWIAGRDSIAQLHLDDRKASRQHFSIEKVGEQYFIKDLGSANGTLLNGQEMEAHAARELQSGDIITINQLTIIFEMRDLSFSEKLKDLPLQVYSGPMILSSQEWDVGGGADAPIPTERLAQLPGTVQKMEPPKNKKRLALMAGVAVVVVLAGLFYPGEQRNPASQDSGVRTIESLSPEEKKMVLDSYTAAQNFYKEGHFQNALNRLNAIHKIIPFYKDSLELQTRLIEAQETLRQKEFIAQQQREQEKTRLKVQAIVADCRDRFQASVDATAAKNCLSEALQLDPENSDAQSILAEIEMRLTQAQEEEKRVREFNDAVSKGRDLFVKAKNLLQNKEYLDAISAFSVHINSNLPDPANLKDESQRNIASIERLMSSQKGELMGRARHLQTTGDLKSAIYYAEQARKVDPFDYTIANFVEQSRHDLEGQMRNLYLESTIEERFGNVELSKTKWKEIVKRDIPTGTYYIKAKRKLQQYGL